ncbi:hypothetical protein ABLO27_07010 [Roseibium sp. SCPC15]|uniref:hypothetical protein n=1 Tax=Roseibium sp. SCP15 TaxID=3141376 RepID=UPI00333CE30E
MRKLDKKSKYLAILDSSKVWFFVFWVVLTAMFWFGHGHQISDFLVLIPYALISGFLAGLMVLRLYTQGHFKNDDELK